MSLSCRTQRRCAALLWWAVLAGPLRVDAQGAAVAVVAPRWTLAEFSDEPVPFQGIASMDGAGSGPGYMVYPVFGLVGAIAALATHAAIVGTTQARQKTKIQQDADKVLDPYRSVLDGFRLPELRQRALAASPDIAIAHMPIAGDMANSEVLVEVVPVFSLTPDAKALVLDETIVVHLGEAAGGEATQTVRVISAPRPEADPGLAWNADSGEALKATAATLLAESIGVALAQAGHPADTKLPFRTLRYSLGDTERMERGQLLEETCARLLMRTLRGGLMYAPHRPGATLPPDCAPASVPVTPQPAVVQALNPPPSGSPTP